MRFYFHPLADEEFDEAARYYERCRSGLGVEFAEEVYATVARISEYPDAWSPMSENTRRCLVNRFPYGIVFQIRHASYRGCRQSAPTPGILERQSLRS